MYGSWGEEQVARFASPPSRTAPFASLITMHHYMKKARPFSVILHRSLSSHHSPRSPQSKLGGLNRSLIAKILDETQASV